MKQKLLHKYLIIIICALAWSGEVWGIDWKNDWSSTPNINSSFYVYNTVSGLFMKAGSSGSGALSTTSSASSWTYVNEQTTGWFGSKTDHYRLKNGNNYLRLNVSTNSTNANTNDTEGSNSLTKGYTEISFSYNSAGFQIFHKVSDLQFYYLFVENNTLKSLYKTSSISDKHEWYFINSTQYANHTALENYETAYNSVVDTYNSTNLPNSFYALVSGHLNPSWGSETINGSSVTCKYSNYTEWISSVNKVTNINTSTTAINNWLLTAADMRTAYANALTTIATAKTNSKNNNPANIAASDISAAETALEAATTTTEIDNALAKIKSFDSVTFDTNISSTILVGNSISNVASASSGRSITYSSSNSACLSISGSTLTALSAGTVTVTATTGSTGGGYYHCTNTRSFTILPVFYFSATAPSSNINLGTTSVEVENNQINGVIGDTEKSTSLTFIATAKDGCTFNGWFEEQDYSGTPVSMNTTYTVTLTNNTAGSRATKTLYAWFKKNPNLQWTDPSLDLNLVKGTTGSSAATAVDDSITIVYTSSNTDAVTIDADGTIHALQEGQSTIKAKVASTFTYNADSLSRVFAVADKQQAAFAPDWWTDENKPQNTDIKVGATTRIALTNVATDKTFRVTTKHGTDTISWERDGNDIVIHAVAEGRDTITLVQDERTTVYGESATYYIKVSKYANPFAVAAESKAMKVGDSWTNVITNRGNRNTPQVSYSVTGIATYNAANNSITANAEGSTVITFTQATTADTLAAKKTINVSVTKVANTLSITLSSLKVSAEVGDPIAVSISGRNNEVTDIVATIATDSISPIKDASYGVISYANGVITARNAGRARITFSQAATTKYTDYESEEYEVTVSKKANSITITNLGGSTATNIKLKYNATAALTYTSTNTDTSPTVTRVSGSYTTYSNGTITAGTAAGTDIYEITQAETYKYESGYAQFTIRVNNTDEAVGYVLYENAKHEFGGWNPIGSYTAPALSGPADILTYEAYRSIAGGNYFFVMASKDEGANYTEIDNPDLPTSYSTFTNQLDEDVNRVKFETRTGATLTKYLNNIFVTRKTYVRASSDITSMGTLYTDQTKTATFTVNYSSTNGGNINISSSNSNFVPSITSIAVESNKTATANDNVQYICGVDGTKTFTVLYTPDPDHLGKDSTVITIADLFYTQQIKLYATSQKYTTSIARGSNTATETTVEGNITNAFVFSGTTTATPSDDEDDDFYYEISHTQTSAVYNGTGVISYNPATNTITGLNQGTARLTIVQKKTRLYNETIHTFDFTVSKLANNVTIALNKTTLNVDDSATVQLTNDDSKGALSAEFTNISYANEDQNRDGGLLSFTVGTKTLKGVNAGTCKVTITQAETYMYESKSAEFNVTINKLAQTLTWDDADLETGMQIGTTLSGNTATSDVGLTPVTYSSSSAAITVNATTGELTAVSVNSNVTITASQAGNYKYLPATITRSFSVFNKKTPAFNADSHFSGSTGQIELTCTARIIVTGVSTGEDFTITYSDEFNDKDNPVLSLVRSGEDNEIITLTGLRLGNATLTLRQEGNDDYIAKTQTYTIEVFWPDDFLTLTPTETPSITEGTYRKVFFNREFSAAGYYSLALPFSTTVATLTGRAANADDWVAQLETVTYSQADGYTLHFNRVSSGVIEANEPYILHLGAEVVNPTWTNVTLSAATATEITASSGYGNNVGAIGIYSDWSMTSNFEAGMSMSEKYGVVNGAGGLKKGGSTATLNAFAAYITPPAGSAGVKVQSAFTDEWGVTTYIKGLPDDGAESEACGDELYDLSGRRIDSRQQPTRGIYVRGGRRVVVK